IRDKLVTGVQTCALTISCERPGDDPTDGVLAREDLARRPAAVVELLQRDRVLVGGDLEDGVRGRVDDPLPGLLVFLPELLDDLRSEERRVGKAGRVRVAT